MRVFFLLGSNLGDRVQLMADARHLIEARIAPLMCSSQLYESAPWGNTQQPYFLNQAIELQSDLAADVLLKACLSVEKQLGRRRAARYAPRSIDIDLLYYGQQVIQRPGLRLPHPEIARRRFTLVPMVEIAPNWMHPLLKKRQKELLLSCTDRLHVQPFYERFAPS